MFKHGFPKDGRRRLCHAKSTLCSVLPILCRGALAAGGIPEYDLLLQRLMPANHHAFGSEGDAAEAATLPTGRLTDQEVCRVLSGQQVSRKLVAADLGSWAGFRRV